MFIRLRQSLGQDGRMMMETIAGLYYPQSTFAWYLAEEQNRSRTSRKTVAAARDSGNLVEPVVTRVASTCRITHALECF